MRYIYSVSSLALAALLSVSVMAAEPNPLEADPFVGKFVGERVTVELNAAANGYAGVIIRNGKTFKATATRNGESLSGTFDADGTPFPFTVTLTGDAVSFSSGKSNFTLTKQSAAVGSSDNPLDQASDNPLDQPSNGQANVSQQSTQPMVPNQPSDQPGQNRQSTVPNGYVIVNSTNFGQALAVKKPGINSIRAALQSTMPELNQYFGDQTQILSAYEDTKDPTCGGASFAAKFSGIPIKGWATCKVYPQGAVVAVIFCRADAPRGEWAKLMNTPARPEGQGGQGQGEAAQQVQLREYKFPDGTGSIGLPQGWTTDAQSEMQPVLIKGPGGQEVMMGYALSIVTPDSQAVQTQLQLEANARQNGFPPPPAMQMLIAPFTPPMEALANLVGQMNQMSQRNIGISFALDNVKELKRVQPYLQGGVASILTYGVTERSRQGQRHLKVLARIECDPVSRDSWMMTSMICRAPDATFDQDLSTMLAIASSVRENPAVIQQKTNENIDAMNQRFAAQQKAHQELVDSYAKSNATWRENSNRTSDRNRDWERNQNRQSRSVDDFDEVIRGYRTVEDTTTGEKTQVDLGNVDQIVDKLNEGQPDRYRQIPLRDESNPIPQGR